MENMVSRYSRQLLLSEIGTDGQQCMSESKVLIIGCGGLGCPSSLYLAGAGIGTIGLVDNDTVALDNLHRQIAYSEEEANSGQRKAQCLSEALKRLNATGSLQVNAISIKMTPDNAIDIISGYDVVLDCTDNPAARYLINDACVLANKPLISASALRWEGQLTIYNATMPSGTRGPCYRCLFPKPPPPEAIGSCSENGVCGPVVGVMGSLQALEAIKFVVNKKDCLIGRLIMFDGLTMNFRTVKLRNSNPDCESCGKNPTIIDLTCENEYTKVYLDPNCCTDSVCLLSSNDRIQVDELFGLMKVKSVNGAEHKKPFILLDVRPAIHYKISHLADSLNIPLRELDDRFKEIEDMLSQWHCSRIITICRQGNDSQRAVVSLRKRLDPSISLSDVEGGCKAWKHIVDPSFIFL